MNPNDAIRNQLLRYFYNRNASATSRRGKKGSAVKISDVKKELKALHGLTQQQVVSNLTYLIDRGWVKTVEIEKTFTVKGGTIPSTVTWYEIAAPGIDKVEGDSEFQPPDRYPGINITASGSSVVTLGDGNYVNVKFRSLHESLDNLKLAVTESSAIPELEKLEVAADIESLKDQLVKTQPNRAVVKTLWSGIENVVTAGEFVALVKSIVPVIAALVS